MVSHRQQWVIARAQGHTILDIGFVGKQGTLHKAIRRNYPDSAIFGVDLAANEMPMRGAITANAMALPFGPNVFDVVVLAETIEHLRNPWPILVEISRVLQIGGRLLLTEPNPYELMRYTRHWMLSRQPWSRQNYRGFLQDSDHKAFWDPLSLCNLLYDCGLTVTEINTKSQRVPILSRWIKRLQSVDLPFYPFNRWGAYLCLKAVRQ
jgi:SAM-dependent methyltransferase